jgi:imidazolonepropionase-like amidohydrolase
MFPRVNSLLDPATDTAALTKVIAVEGERFKAVGASLAVPAGGTAINRSEMIVMPGLADAGTHTTLTSKEQPRNNYHCLTYVMESTPLRAACGLRTSRRPRYELEAGSASGAVGRSRIR